MKNLSLIITLLCLGLTIQAQSLSVELSTDSVLIGNTIMLKFHIEDSEAEFEAPAFENMDIVGGPNFSSSVQIINGEMSSEKNITYYLRPKEIGTFYIPPAYLVDKNYTLETEALELRVYPNPEGIIVGPKMEHNLIFDDFEWPEFPEFNLKKPLPATPGKSKSKQPLRKI